ncbi:MAG: Ger(x)C family spore germination C-terminal domain-containing protein [Christensenellales bacterium]
MVALWKKNKILFVFLIALILIFPNAISKESISYTHLICVALGIDKVENEYEVSLQVIVPKQANAFNETLKVISGKAETINEAVQSIRYHVGKEIGFSQCGFIIFNEEASKENILVPIDYFVRTHNINYNCILVCTDKSASKILELNGELGQSYSFDLNRILEYNERFLFSKDTNVEQLYRSYLSPNTAFATSLVSATDDQTKGIEGEDIANGGASGSSGGGSGGASGGSGAGGGQNEENILSNDTNIALFKNGKFFARIKDDEINAIEYLSSYGQGIKIKVANFTDDYYDNATIEINVANKYCKCDFKIKGDKLIVNCDTLLYLQIDDINQKSDFRKFTKAEQDYFTDTLIEQIKKQEKQRVDASINKLKELNLDLIDVYSNFNRWCHNDFMKFLDNLENRDDYFQNVEVNVNFNIVKL